MSKYTPTFSEPDYTGGVEILCPCCGDRNLHIKNSEVYHRIDGEDSVTLRTRINPFGGKVFTSRDRSKQNPSPRRDGLRLNFRCENCEYGLNGHSNGLPQSLEIFQHKGVTHMRWSPTPENKESL